jgi:acyl carrier protein
MPRPHQCASDVERFTRVIEQALDAPRGSVASGDRIEDLPQWDSPAAITIVAAIVRHYDVVIDAMAFDESKTVAELAQMVAEKQSEKR